MNPLVEALLKRRTAQAAMRGDPMADPTLAAAQGAPQVPNAAPGAADGGVFAPNTALEQQTAGVSYPVHPLVLAIAQKLGLMNPIRNSKNKREDILQSL